MIVIVNGALGVGKTSTAWALLELFERGVMLEGDRIGAVRPFRLGDPARLDYLYETLAQLVRFHTEHGYPDFVVDYVFEDPASLRDLRERLYPLAGPTQAFRLVCSPAEGARRIRARGEPDAEARVARQRELVEIQHEAAMAGDLGLVLDTSEIDPPAAAATLLHAIQLPVDLVEADRGWPEAFEHERAQIAAALGTAAVSIEPIGSTAVAGLAAKPIIDIALAVRDLDRRELFVEGLQRAGWAFLDWPENIERCLFRKPADAAKEPTHHLHVMRDGEREWLEHLAFRDALRADAALRKRYDELKRKLARQHSRDRRAYSSAKTDFVRDVLASAGRPSR